MKIRYYKISDLKPAEYNPRKLTKKQKTDLKLSLEKFGAVEPAVINIHPKRNHVIIGGHQRIAVAQELGWAEYPCYEVNLPLDNWNYDKPIKSDLHPTMKPIPLVANAILNSSQESDIILDSFLGSGTTLIAAEQLKRICYGMEIEPRYCDVIITRWCKYTGKSEIKLNGKEITWKTQ